MIAREKHAMATRLFAAGQKPEALTLLRELIGEEASSEIWSDWAAVQFSLNCVGEADKGFRIALELDGENLQAAFNLGMLLCRGNSPAEARPFLEKSLAISGRADRDAAEKLLAQLPREADEAATVENYLRRFVSDSLNEQSYFETHVRRYVATLQQLPRGDASMHLLELGAAFHHLTPALLTRSGYGHVRCSDIWQGAARENRTIVSRDSQESFQVTVDNFDFQRQPWPYRDGEFDAVLCCEILEHLHTDPMGLIAEINRILKPGGILLLTTPNLASAHAVQETMCGGSPYAYGKFELGGKPTDRHNREYTAAEVGQMALAGGFGIATLRTLDFYWPGKRETFVALAAHGYPIAGRGDATFLLARKQSAVKERYPEALYARVGVQAERRNAQSGNESQEQDKPVADGLPKNILLIHEILPHHDCSGADLRLYELIRELRGQNHAVTFLARDDRDEARYRPAIEALGAKVFAGDPERLRHTGCDRLPSWELRDVLKRGQFDMAILSHWFWSGISVAEQYIDEIRRYSPATCVLVLSEDRHGERERRLAKLTGHLSDVERANDFEQREAEIYRRADMVLYVTETDQQRFLELVPGLLTEHLPTISEAASAGPGFAERSGVLFLGNFDNLANQDALAWLLENVWPLVRRAEPALNLYIAGNAAPEGLDKRYAGVNCIGKIPKLDEQFDLRRVFVAPIRYGTGIITKNMHALAHGLPVVTTAVGAEGLQLQNETHGMIADDPADFAAAIVRLHREAALWEKIAAEGRKYIHEKFSLANLQAQIRKIVQRACAVRPRKPEAQETWSYRLVEAGSPWVLTQEPAHYRPMLRSLAYWQFGKQLLNAGDAKQAIEQFRHIFTTVRGPLPVSVFHTAVLDDLARAYSALGDREAAERCAKEHRKCVWMWKTKLVDDVSEPNKTNGMTIGQPTNTPEISVVLPTYNRSSVLRLSLAALAFASLPAKRWEVVVIDDGSTDDTEALCRNAAYPFKLTYLYQKNQGAGAARREGVEAATGEFLLLCNDDTIASSNLLVEHLQAHRDHRGKQVAVLGAFRHSDDVGKRALSVFVNTSAFFFPQRKLKADQFYDQAHFVTCNISVRRGAVLAVGNFDAKFRVAEDTELGTRLVQRGLKVVYRPDAVAWHEHAGFTSRDLLRRAQSYGSANWDLFAKHPQLLGIGEGPFGRLAPEDRARIQEEVSRCRGAVANSLRALEALDVFDFRQIFKDQEHGSENAEDLLRKLNQIVPMVYWHYLFESFLERWQQANPVFLASPTIPQPQVQARRA
jgi:GT2 family glycosyltransferase/glycosyltransferase involved in cell wall biosynthesis/2-polyprenyl-3-methyl-5-hydroxy-6-metoxy-1,4-benzoquinol methylase